MYQIGVVYVWQNQSGILAHLNGLETVVLGLPEEYEDIDTGMSAVGQETDTIDDGYTVYAEPGDLRRKNPPSGEKSVMDLFEFQPEMEPS